jgi:hypothetical protein
VELCGRRGEEGMGWRITKEKNEDAKVISVQNRRVCFEDV